MEKFRLQIEMQIKRVGIWTTRLAANIKVPFEPVSPGDNLSLGSIFLGFLIRKTACKFFFPKFWPISMECYLAAHYMAIRVVEFSNCTEVHFTSFLSGVFTTMAIINPPERKLAKRTSEVYTVLPLQPIYPQYKIHSSFFSTCDM